MTAQANNVLHIQTDDIDQFHELTIAMGWQNHTQQIATGNLGLDISAVDANNVKVFRTSAAVGTVREMVAPEHSYTVGLLIPSATSNRWCGRSHGGPALLKMPNGDFTGVTAGAVLGYQLAFPETMMEEALGFLELPDHVPTDAIMKEIDRCEASNLAGALDQFISQQPNQPSLDCHALLDRFLLTFPAGQISVYRDRARHRRRVFNQARDYMRSHLGDAITLADVCRQIGASRRSVTQAFHEHLDISPMAYLKIIRLNQVRSQLVAARDADTRIVDIANDLSFWHMGQFAQDYRNRFGELPSDTLAKHAL